MDGVLKHKGSSKVRLSTGDRIFGLVNGFFLVVLLLLILLPLVHMLAVSVSDANLVLRGEITFIPSGINFKCYEALLGGSEIPRAYYNTIRYTFFGVLIDVAMTALCAYPLSRRDMQWKGFYMFVFVFTMYFGGGLIPTYLTINNLDLTNTFWVMVLPGLISVYNMIITRTFIQNNIPQEMLEASQIDGCSDFQYFYYMVLPLSKAVIAVITLYYAVGHWNSYFNALIYLTDRDRYPLQIILREILVANQVNFSEVQGIDPEQIAAQNSLANQLKYALIIVSCGPILLAYPFVQKYFVKGVMIGSVKG